MADLTELGRCTKTGRLSVQSGELKRAPKPSEHSLLLYASHELWSTSWLRIFFEPRFAHACPDYNDQTKTKLHRDIVCASPHLHPMHTECMSNTGITRGPPQYSAARSVELGITHASSNTQKLENFSIPVRKYWLCTRFHTTLLIRSQIRAQTDVPATCSSFSASIRPLNFDAPSRIGGRPEDTCLPDQGGLHESAEFYSSTCRFYTIVRCSQRTSSLHRCGLSAPLMQAIR
jgi:hypothetical protein